MNLASGRNSGSASGASSCARTGKQTDSIRPSLSSTSAKTGCRTADWASRYRARSADPLSATESRGGSERYSGGTGLIWNQRLIWLSMQSDWRREQLFRICATASAGQSAVGGRTGSRNEGRAGRDDPPLPAPDLPFAPFCLPFSSLLFGVHAPSRCQVRSSEGCMVGVAQDIALPSLESRRGGPGSLKRSSVKRSLQR